MRVWYNSELDRATIQEIHKLLVDLQDDSADENEEEAEEAEETDDQE